MSNEYAVDVDAKLASPLPIASPSSVVSAERLNYERNIGFLVYPNIPAMSGHCVGQKYPPSAGQI
jgi:hypothetical protein